MTPWNATMSATMSRKWGPSQYSTHVDVYIGALNMVKNSKVADVPLIGMVSLILIVEYFNRLQLATISENERSHERRLLSHFPCAVEGALYAPGHPGT